MHPAVAFALFLVGTLLWLGLPFIPAIMELVHPRDAAPLDAVGRDAGALTFFADGFRRYLGEMNLDTHLKVPVGAVVQFPEPLFRFRDATPVRLLRSEMQVALLAEAPSVPRTGDAEPQAFAELLVLDAPVTLPNDMAYEREVYARREVVGGARSYYRALLADRSATLGPQSVVLRWVHSDERLTVGAGSVLTGRATARDELRLGPGVRFQRMLAGRIVVGTDDTEFVAPVLAESIHTTPWLPDNAVRMASDTLRIDGDVVLPAGAYASGHLVITGSVVIGRESRIDGSVKAHGSITLGEHCVVTGTLAAREAIAIGEGCRVSGPVIAEMEVTVGANSWIGQPTQPTTITAPRIVLAHGVTVFGAVQAREEGWTTE